MEELIESLKKATNQENWHASLFIALSLPDICGKLEYPNESVGNRFKKWFNSYLQDSYIKKVGSQKEEVTFLNASDCYALRCALLHEGSDDIGTQRAKEVLNKFVFSTTMPHLLLHNNRTLVLNVEEFCKEMYSAVTKWFKETNSKVEILTIHTSISLNL